MSMYRPRGTLAKAIHAKFHNDSFIEGFDTTIWYHIAKELPAKYQCKYVSFEGPDETTLQWLERAKSQASNIWVHIWHALARSVLQFFMTQTDINGWLKRGSMFILSEKQFEELLNASGFKVNCTEPLYLLDIGAGDGEISIRLRNAIEHTLHKNCDNPLPVRSFATETSWTMRDRLKKLNFEVLENLKNVSSDQFQLIACLNVLDRCIDPHELLMEIYTALASNGRAVFALVLPYVHYVEMNSSHLPIRPLMNHWPEHAKKLPFETEAACFLELLENCGFQIEAWTKAPYLCEGDLHQSYYWLTDFIVVVSKRPTAASAF